MKRMLLVLSLLAIPVSAYAQTPIEETDVWVEALKFVVGATGIMLVAQALLYFGLAGTVPGWLKPLIGPLFGVLAGIVSPLVGFVPDFSPLIGILIGTAAANLFDLSKAIGILKSTG